MKKIIHFNRAFLITTIFSCAIILIGVVGLFTKGINYGIDFQAGFIEKVRIAPTAFSLSYKGSQAITVEQSASSIVLVSTGVGSDNQTWTYPYAQYPTVSDFSAAVSSIPGISVKVENAGSVSLKSVFVDSEALSRLSATPYRFHYNADNGVSVTSDDIRSALSAYPSAAVQEVGKASDNMFQIRIGDDGTDPNASQTIRENISAALNSVWGDENVVVISTDFVGSRFSASLAQQAFWLVLGTLVLIGGYATFRFRWDFALGAIVGIFHDALIMVAFIVWTRMEFNSMTIAAVLTILGYSINDTIVVFDRIRENTKLNPTMSMKDLLNLSQSEMLGRSIITTVTTMLAVISLYIFTTGDMQNFALALLIGLVSGVYSSVFIASAVINVISRFRKDKGIIKEKVKKVTSGEVV
ncbi:MAG TPA: protein translocase subunit SecF [Treponemataceae bacterium]|nr:protein translocase subunit SecF [Treponemataceae bacterium]